jgi:fructan beta-fructosidase
MKNPSRGIFTGIVSLLCGMSVSVSAQYPEFPYPITNYDEPYRAQFHFSSQGGWMNDVNGVWFYKGTYHMTYQHYPHGLAWAQMHWGHATSTDMMHWVQKPIALEPDTNVPGDCYSGSVVVDSANTSGFQTGTEQVFVAIYTATKHGTCLAYSNDKGATWQAYSGNPVAIGTTNESTRDPHVFWHAPSNKWVCAEFENGITFYTSPNLKTWTKTGTISFGNECPDIYELAVDGGATKKWVLQDASSSYHIGTFNGTTFTSDAGGPWMMDACSDFYASQTFFRNNFPDNRVIQMAWIRGTLNTSPWTHEASFPCEIKLKTFSEGVRTTRYPIAEISSLYGTSQYWGLQTVSSGSNLLSGVKSKCFDIIAGFDLTGATATAINFVFPNKTVTYDITNKTLLGQSLAPINNKIRIRLLVDWGELEAFGNDGKLSWTQNIAFTQGDSAIGLSVNGNVHLDTMEFHSIQRIWPNAAFVPNFKTNLTGTWNTVSGTWADVSTGKQGSGSSDAFCLNTQTDADFTYEGDVTLMLGTAGALVFRANAGATAGYCVNIDAGGIVKLWAPGRGELARYTTAIQVGVTTYHLKVVTLGSNIKVYFNNGTNPVINYTDATPTLNGMFGLNVFSGTAVFQDIYRNGIPVGIIRNAETRDNLFSCRASRIISGDGPVRINYSVPTRVDVSLALFDLHGRMEQEIVIRSRSRGQYSASLGGCDGRIPAGYYVYRFIARAAGCTTVLFEKNGNIVLQR